MSTFRGMGPWNAVLPAATGQVIQMMRDPAKMPYNRYVQYITAPDEGGGLYRYAVMHPDDPVRLAGLNDYVWALDDPAPTGRAFKVNAKWEAGQTSRFAFPYTLGDRTAENWRKAGIDAKMLYDRYRVNHAMLHRASRVVTALRNASWGANSSTLAALLASIGVSGAFFDQSSGTELLPDGTPNPKFQIIKKVFQLIKRRMNLASNGALTGEEFVAVLPVDVAIAMSYAGEIVNALKQSPHAKELTNPNIVDWSLPESYGGFKLVVEDTVRVFIRENYDGTVADVTQSDQKDYILNTDSIYFTSRPGGIDGQAGFQNFSTVQCYHWTKSSTDNPGGGIATVTARGDSWNELTEGRVVIEDEIRVPSTLAGFELKDTLSTG